MDNELHEFQFLGFCGILKQSFKLVHQWRRVFAQISLALILPISILFFAHFHISEALFSKVLDNQDKLYNNSTISDMEERDLRHAIASDLTYLWLFKIAYIVILLLLALLATAAVVYSVASAVIASAARPLTFKTAMRAVPKVWKRLAVTFIWSFVIVLAYNIVAVAVIVGCVAVAGLSAAGIVLLAVVTILYIAVLIYIGVVWNLASVVSVLEESYGIKALKKARALTKGKTLLSVALFVLFAICIGAVEALYENLTVVGVVDSLAVRILAGIVSVALLAVVLLYALVSETLLYFVCKSFHHEIVDKSLLSDHLEVYLGNYVSLRQNNNNHNVQLSQV